ncbi:hypothetical protein COX59_00835, partial [Candidatus Beckwithbacteria bacterium CG_4_10_14_0_2_um_filter_47_25]
EIAVQAVFLQDLIIDFYHNPQNCTDTSQQCRETFSAYLKSNINSQHPELWEQPNFQYGFDSLIGGYGDYNQAIQCVVWDIALKGLGVNTAPISGMLGEKANDIYDVLVKSNPSLNMSTTDFVNLAQANASLNNNYTYGAGGNTLHLFNNFDSLQPSDCFFYGSGVGHTGCIIDVINNASGETLLVVSESNSPVNGTPTGLPETYYLTEADWGKKIGAAFQSVWFLRPK